MIKSSIQLPTVSGVARAADRAVAISAKNIADTYYHYANAPDETAVIPPDPDKYDSMLEPGTTNQYMLIKKVEYSEDTIAKIDEHIKK